MIIVTGANSRYFKRLVRFIYHFELFGDGHRLIVYNLGLRDDELKSLKTRFSSSIMYKTFDFTKYPEHFNINVNKGVYAWKPIIVQEVCEEYGRKCGGLVIWMDTGNVITDSFKEFEQILLEHSIYSPRSSGDIRTWTHPGTLKYMNWTKLDLRNRAGGCVGVNYKIDWVRDLIKEWKDCSLVKEHCTGGLR